jgi:hypothetical protein
MRSFMSTTQPCSATPGLGCCAIAWLPPDVERRTHQSLSDLPAYIGSRCTHWSGRNLDSPRTTFKRLSPPLRPPIAVEANDRILTRTLRVRLKTPSRAFQPHQRSAVHELHQRLSYAFKNSILTERFADNHGTFERRQNMECIGLCVCIAKPGRR